jgi:hypothetical protein
MVTGTQMQTAWVLGIRDLAEMMETCLAEIKHKGGLKLRHPEPLVHGRPLHAMINNRQATTTMLLPSALQPAWPLSCSSNMLWRPSGDQTECFLAGATLGKKKKKKKQNSETLNPQPVKSFSKPHYTEKIGGIQHCQTLALNLLGRCRPTGEQISRQTGLDARGVTPEQVRLKFYCSWTYDLFSFFFLVYSFL